MTSIPEAPLISVCVEIFSFPEVEWENNTYDAAVLCVDRHSGWMIAQPSHYTGLTAEKCAHLLLDGGWTHFGVPSVVTSDQGTQFAGQWFQTMCGREASRTTPAETGELQISSQSLLEGRRLRVKVAQSGALEKLY